MKRIGVSVIGIAMLAVLVPTQPVAAGAPEVSADIEIVVKLAEVDPRLIDEVMSEHGVQLIDVLAASRNVFVVGASVLVKADKLDEELRHEARDLAKRLSKDDSVQWADAGVSEPGQDRRFHAWPDAGFDEVETIDGLDLAGQPAFAGLQLDIAHDDATGVGTVVAILDTGIDSSHPLLAGRVRSGWDLIDDDADPSEEADGIDDDGDGTADEAFGHGTFVAGVVAEVAPDAELLPVRVLDGEGRAPLYAVVEGIDFAVEMGADVINLSFGLAGNEKPKPLREALKRAKDADVLVVGAAGNTGTDDKLYPASEGSVMSVAAVDNDDRDEVASFSSHGAWVRVAAPGVDVVSAVPGAGYARWAGTSMAAPVVTGQAALLVEVDPGASRSAVAKALKDTARKMKGKSRAEKGVIDILESLQRMH